MSLHLAWRGLLGFTMYIRLDDGVVVVRIAHAGKGDSRISIRGFLDRRCGRSKRLELSATGTESVLELVGIKPCCRNLRWITS